MLGEIESIKPILLATVSSVSQLAASIISTVGATMSMAKRNQSVVLD